MIDIMREMHDFLGGRIIILFSISVDWDTACHCMNYYV